MRILPSLGVIVALSQPLQAQMLSPDQERKCREEVVSILNMAIGYDKLKEMMPLKPGLKHEGIGYQGQALLRDEHYFACVERGVRLQSSGKVQFGRLLGHGPDLYRIDVK